MTGLDLVLAVLIVLTVYGGARRGLILEMTDWCVFVLGSWVALCWYRTLAEMLRFVGWEQFALRIWSGALLFGVVGLPLVVLGLMVERSLGHKVPKPLTQACGVTLAVAKAFLLAWLAVVAVWYLPAEPAVREARGHGPVVSLVVRCVSPQTESFVYAVAPRSVAVDLVPTMRSWRF
jgi:uncharacterized membrane protein required for colicin V production